MDKKYCDYIREKTYNLIKEKGFKKIIDDEVETFFDGKISYKVECSDDNKRVTLLKCSDTGNQKSWVNASKWLMDAVEFTQKDANMIVEDFAETILGTEKKTKNQSGIRNENDESNVDGLFMANRIVNLFPELKDDLTLEKECYENFRILSFVKGKVLPKVKLLFDSNDKSKAKKFIKLMSDLYNTGNLDVRSIITITILNSLDEEKVLNIVQDSISDELKKAWEAALKFKGKKVKPEKIKKKSTFMSETLEARK